MADSSVVTIYVHDYDEKLIVGSGIVIDKDGLILSNAHVFRSWQSAEVYNQSFTQSFTIDKNCLKKDLENDVALFRIDTTNLTPISFGNSAIIEKGDDIFCMGSPANLINTFSQGTIGGMPFFNAGLKNLRKQFIQFSAKIFEGSSGGALLDKTGRLVGMTTGSIKNIETGFAIPVSRIIESIKLLGSIESCGEKIPIKIVEPSISITNLTESTDQGLGEICFWTNCNSCFIEIFIDDESIGTLESYFSKEPNCGQRGTISKKLYAGLHKIHAEDKKHHLVWNSTQYVIKDQCDIFKVAPKK